MTMLALPFSHSGELVDADHHIGQVFVDALRTQFGNELLFVVVFGSKARGDDDEESDMDLLVVLKHVSLEIRRQVRDLATEIWLENGVYLSTRVWDEPYWQKMAALSTSLYRNICEDGILLYKQTPLVQ
jgi:predicted nucleotidyltransferase